ncbi:predicted protein [Naegleria gruberi]|uniref:Predicted protein n=1 Tax=Naegleria gruberi TaxID=5762 RepID=D2VXD9_NAEGR|nr:uncharacterized protein NAEGRDRAFT_59497 [Naegleria gruberi]EFC38491.1 predicted protein [Naegleria gruberi]|eukprot:XP_002671235.1 predicted protein [Naegleria gruberi strain NEG-M]
MLVNYEEEFLPKNGGLAFKKLARDLFSYKITDKIKELQKVNPNMILLIDWESILSLPEDLKWKARREELSAKENVILYLKFSRRITYLCEDLPVQFCKDPDCKEAFMELKKMILHIKHDPSSTQSNGCNLNEYAVKGDELHVTIVGNLPELMREANDGSQPDAAQDIKVLTNCF